MADKEVGPGYYYHRIRDITFAQEFGKPIIRSKKTGDRYLDFARRAPFWIEALVGNFEDNVAIFAMCHQESGRPDPPVEVIVSGYDRKLVLHEKGGLVYLRGKSYGDDLLAGRMMPTDFKDWRQPLEMLMAKFNNA